MTAETSTVSATISTRSTAALLAVRNAQRVAGAAIALIGIVVLVTLLSTRLFSRAPALADFNDDFRPVMTEASIGALRADVDQLDAASAEFGTTVLPTVAAALGQTPEELSAFLAEDFPAVAAGVQALPPTVEQFRGLIDLLEAERGRFGSLDAIPAEDVNPKTVPPGILVIGLLLVAVGAWIALTRSQVASIVALVAGAAVVAITLGLSLQSKAADADEVGRNVAPVFTTETVAQARGALDTVGAMAEELQTNALPAIGQAAGIPADQRPTFIGENFPALAAAMQGLPEASARFAGAVDLIERNIPRYETVSPVPFGRVIWIVTWAAILTGLVGIGLVVGSHLGARRER